MVNNIRLVWNLEHMFRTYRTCNPTMKFSKYKFINKLLGGVILIRVTSDVTWTKLYVNYNSLLKINIEIVYRIPNLFIRYETCIKVHNSRTLPNPYPTWTMWVGFSYEIFLIKNNPPT